MKPSTYLLSCVLLSSFALCQAGTAWSKPVAKKQTKNVLIKKPSAKLHKAVTATTLAVPVVAVAAALPAQQGESAVSLVPVDHAQQTAQTAPAPQANPYLANHPQFTPPDPMKSIGQLIKDVKMALPSMPPSGQSILPVLKTVYPTGEKPLVVLTFKCPTELIGITPLPTKALHDLVNLGMDGINSTNLLAFNMQQVCQ